MSDWVKKKLGDIAKEVRDTYEPNQSEDIPYVGLEHIAQQDLKLVGTGKSSDTQSTKRKFNSGDILFGSLRPYFRKVVRPKFDGVCSTDITVIRSKNGVDQGFLNYLIASKDFIDHSDKISSGSRMPRANWKVLEESEWNIPDKETQQKIASILSAFDNLIENNTRRIVILEEMTRLIYREWFVHYRYPGAQGSGEQATPGHENDFLVGSGTELGEVPEGWEIGTIGDLYDVKSGFAFKSKKLVDQGSFGVIKIGNIQSGDIDVEGVQFIENDEIPDRASKFKLHPGDVLIAMTGAKVGKVGIMPKTKNPYYLNQRVGKYFGKNELLKSHLYLYTFLNSREAQANIEHLAQGAAQPNISATDLKSLKLSIPPDQILNEFEQVTLPMRDEILTLRQKNVKLKETRDLLLPKLISGKVGV